MSQYFKNQQGFSLTELLVTLSIVGVLMTVILTHQGTYTDTAGLSSVADDIAITISQAQAYGIAVRERSAGSANFASAYGLTISLLGTGSNKAYLFFSDLDGDLAYDGDWNCATGSGLECLQKVNISRGHYIESLCVIPATGADQCGTVGRLDVSFLRPDTDARLTFFNTSGTAFTPAGARGARIVLRSPRGVTKRVGVYYNGQVSVQ
jgi:prepilin-type N-terminal cleavage/methylation domain-containing protein